MRALVRDNFTCRAFDIGLSTEPCTENRLRFLHVHHLKERINGGNHELDNLLTICRAHHIKLHPYMAFEYAIKDKEIENGNEREL